MAWQRLLPRPVAGFSDTREAGVFFRGVVWMQPTELFAPLANALDARPRAPKVLVLSGPSGCGKTRLCARVAELARAQGLAVGGVLTPARYDGSRKVGLDAEDLRTGCSWPLAEGTTAADGPTTGAWHFHGAGLEAGRQALEHAVPCHILIVDELGPLELERGEGWRVAIDVLASEQFRLGLAVVRPALVPRFLELLGVPDLPVVRVTPDHCEELAGRILSELGDVG